MKLPYGEEIGHYWQTSRTAPDTWIERAKKVLSDAGGKILTDAYGATADGRAAFMLIFKIGDSTFKLVWPVLPSSTGNEKAAKIQAATLLYHDVKAKAVAATVMGAETAFFSYLLLQDGRVTSELALPELHDVFPKLLAGG